MIIYSIIMWPLKDWTVRDTFSTHYNSMIFIIFQLNALSIWSSLHCVIFFSSNVAFFYSYSNRQIWSKRRMLCAILMCYKIISEAFIRCFSSSAIIVPIRFLFVRICFVDQICNSLCVCVLFCVFLFSFRFVFKKNQIADTRHVTLTSYSYYS